jgi:hypothetical protein
MSIGFFALRPSTRRLTRGHGQPTADALDSGPRSEYNR